MIRWEYKIDIQKEDWNNVFTQEGTDAIRAVRLVHLDELGNQGWELIKIEYFPDGMYTHWKRALT